MNRICSTLTGSGLFCATTFAATGASVAEFEESVVDGAVQQVHSPVLTALHRRKLRYSATG